ncbi:penicillin-binding protein 1A [Vibrio nitrifigilis]|uniref:Penicillin-binding protein 1A n=1 Tax=Vibrio nitrifigilis TaxID=2789781 RepID=A0ABS0GHJ7_9VIBR|nr:PBP1A family penicillin-binding protein [Vibrio nitrifigilis]MBF9001790.1 PBP1A family penicillin-binding protein [Vibrio nitrifigilis]
MKFIKRLVIFSLICTFLGVTTIFGFYLYVKPELPDVATLKDVKLQTPMQVYSQDGKLIAQFGEKRRIPLKLDQMPKELIDAFIATEDSRFYEHYGFDPIGIARAAVAVMISGSATQGASTITQQLARNFFLSNEKKIMRKIKEIFIAVHIEQLLTKDEILELYLNKIYLGYRSYGVGAAAQVYFGKEVKDLTLGEMATIAGLPKAPSTMNPIYSIKRATKRRNVVLARMLDENYITREQYEQAKAEPLVAKYHGAEVELNAPYVAELARAWMVKHYGDDVYTSGKKVYTTVNSKLQEAANHAAVNNLLAYDERHGYRGAIKQLWKDDQPAWDTDKIEDYLTDQPTYGELYPAVVTQVNDQTAQVTVKNHGQQVIAWQDMNWARRFITDNRQGPLPETASDILSPGDQIWVQPLTDDKKESEDLPSEDPEVLNEQRFTHWKLSQVPNANTAFVAMNPENGAVKALVGGFNFVHNKFNRATQSVRQVGSSIKPFIYSAAIDSGMTLATLINDAPINQWDKSQGTAWRPQNSPPTYGGPTRIRIGLAQSKNVMAVRTLREVGLDKTRHYLTRFGFDLDKLPRSETIALGAGSLTPVKLAQGYSVFANGGYYVQHFYINRVEGPFGDVEYKANPKIICRKDCQTNKDNAGFDEHDANTEYAPQVISAQNAFLVREMMYSNIWGGGNWSHGTGWNGTGWRAQVLHRRDIGGKTGTTNDSKDAWYDGFAPDLVATAWVGFDDHSRDLGHTTPNPNIKDDIHGAEAGAKTAQPAWIEFMKHALADVPHQNKQIPDGIIRVRIDRATGLLTNKPDYTSMFEYFIKGTEPKEYVSDGVSDNIYTTPSGDDSSLF